MPSLILSYNNQELHTYPVEGGRLIKIGRSDQNDIIIDEKAVSSVHAEIEFESDGYYITDIQSKNGTFVDGELVISRKSKNIELEKEIQLNKKMSRELKRHRDYPDGLVKERATYQPPESTAAPALGCPSLRNLQ